MDSESDIGGKRLGKYQFGSTIGKGTFSKIKFAKNVVTGKDFAIKILDKKNILKNKIILNQIKREISTAKLIKHPNIIRMYEIMASKKKIYIVLELVNGGVLFEKIAKEGMLTEAQIGKYFEQLINAVDYCHRRGVFHGDLKVKNLLLDSNGDLKVSDFGLSGLPQQVGENGLHVYTNYVSPEVICENNEGYDGAKADIWSCGVILYALMAGYLPFEGSDNVDEFYKKISKAQLIFPRWFSGSVSRLIGQILNPNPETRITAAEILDHNWFKRFYKSSKKQIDEVYVNDVLLDPQEAGTSAHSPVPATMNAFELISTSQGLNLGYLFEKKMGLVKRETRFTSKCSANYIISKIEETAGSIGFDVMKNNYKMKIQGGKVGRKGYLSIATEIFEVAPSLYVVDFCKSSGDAFEFYKFYEQLTSGLEDIVWKSTDELDQEIQLG